MGFLRNRVTAMLGIGAVTALAALTVDGCSGSGHSAAGAKAAAHDGPTPQPCSSTYIAMSAGRRTGSTSVTQAVDVTNNGPSACVVDGYPGVNLIGHARGEDQYEWTLQWATASHTPVTLAPGGVAHFDVVYLAAAGTTATSLATTPSPAPTAIDVLNITITLPNTYTEDQMPWSASIVLQDQVAHAQTYVTPFVAGAA